MELKKLLLFGLASTFILTACDTDEPESTEDESAEVNTTEVEAETDDETEDESGEEGEETEEEEIIEETEELTEEEEEVEASDREIVLGDPMDIGDYTMTIQDYSLGKDYEGKDALIITYDWVNNSDDSASPFMTFNIKGFQDNVETSDVFMVDGINLEDGQKEVRPEGEIKGAQAAVGIDDMTIPIELELDLLITFESNPFNAILDPSSLE